MPRLQLPHSSGCLVCGRDNPRGLHLDLFVDSETGIVTATFSPSPHHIGFDGIAHGGILATVLDEAMTWAATWHGKRLCFCGELTNRFRRPARIESPLQISASVATSRSRRIETTATLREMDGTLIAESTGKYVPLPPQKHLEMLDTFLPTPHTSETAKALQI
jgi:acyl-coenzyme A thioesterase PaaI-like protein